MVEQLAIYVDRRCETSTIRKSQRPPVGEWSGLLDILLLHFDTIQVCTSPTEAIQLLGDIDSDVLVILQNKDERIEEPVVVLSDAALLRQALDRRPGSTLLAGIGFAHSQESAIDFELLPTSSSIGQAVTQLAQQDTQRFEKPEFAPTRDEWFSLRTRLQRNHLQKTDELLDLHLAQEMPTEERSKEIASDGELQSLVSAWHFSCLTLNNNQLDQSVFIMFKHVLAQPGLEPWHLSDDALRSFISTVRSAYHRLNPYHNFRHAVDVLQALFYFTLSSSALPSFAGDHLASQRTLPSAIADLFTPQYILALMIVGLGHDVGHPGVNNAFLVATQAPLAVLYNDRSVLENLHGAALSRILCKHWPATQEPVMRKIILELVLSTDMALHFDYMTKFSDINSLLASNELKQNANSASISKLRLIIFAGLVKCADICNVARPLEVSKLWSSALLREFFNQGYLERSLGMPITKSFDPKQTVQAESQIFFTEMFAIPLFDSLKAALPILEPLIAQMQSNKAYWSAMRQNTVEPNKTSSAAAGQQTDSEVLMKSPNQTGCFSVFQRKR